MYSRTAFSGNLACYRTDSAGTSRNALGTFRDGLFRRPVPRPFRCTTPETLPGAKARSAPAWPTAAAPVYEVFAIRYASIPDFPVSALIAGADPQRKLSIAMTVWLIRGNGRNILVDSGFYRPQFFKQFKVEVSSSLLKLSASPASCPQASPRLRQMTLPMSSSRTCTGTTRTVWTFFPRRASGCKKMNTPTTPEKPGRARAPMAALSRTTCLPQ